MCKATDANQIITDASALVKYYNKSGIYSDDNVTYVLKSFCEWRWNSVQEMLSSIYDNYDDVYVKLSAREKDFPSAGHVSQKLTCLPKHELNAMLDFLAPFKKMITELEAENYTTLHSVWPIYEKLRTYFQPKISDSDVIADMRRIGQQYFIENIDDFKPQMTHKLAVFLHPMLKSMEFAPLSTVIEIHSYVEMQFVDYNLNNLDDSQIIDEANQSQSLFDEFLSKIDTHSPPERSNELQRYIDFKIDKVGLNIVLL